MALPFLESLRQGLEACGELNGPVIVGVSGGADSMALMHGLRLLSELTLELRVVHVDHGLRPGSADDAEYVRTECDRHQLDCQVVTLDLSMSETRGGLEETARKARYQALCAEADRIGCHTVAVGHHADDNAETILHHILRGTGLTGLTGIPRARDLDENVRLIRPLLGITREEIQEFLSEQTVEWLCDESNQDTGFTRNRIRHELLPLLEKDFNPQVRSALLRLSAQATELHEAVQGQLVSLPENTWHVSDGQVTLRCDLLIDVPRALVRSLLLQIWTEQGWPRRRMGFEDWNALASLIRKQSGARDLPGGIHADRRKATLTLKRT